MDAVGHRLNTGVQELGGALPVSAVRQAGDRELRGPVDGNEQVELAFTRSNLGDVEVKEPDRIGLEPGPSGACRTRRRAGERCRGAGGSGAGWTMSDAAVTAAGHRGSHRAVAACGGGTPPPQPSPAPRSQRPGSEPTSGSPSDPRLRPGRGPADATSALLSG